jgi:hypothetical protein
MGQEEKWEGMEAPQPAHRIGNPGKIKAILPRKLAGTNVIPHARTGTIQEKSVIF